MKSNKNSIISDKIAESMCAKNDRAFWREIKNYSNSKLKLPNSPLAKQTNPNMFLLQGFLMEMLCTWSGESENAGC